MTHADPPPLRKIIVIRKSAQMQIYTHKVISCTIQSKFTYAYKTIDILISTGIKIFFFSLKSKKNDGSYHLYRVYRVQSMTAMLSIRNRPIRFFLSEISNP